MKKVIHLYLFLVLSIYILMIQQIILIFIVRIEEKKIINVKHQFELKYQLLTINNYHSKLN